VAVLPVGVTGEAIKPRRSTTTGTGLDHPHGLSRLW
jgi:hypothetical protein